MKLPGKRLVENTVFKHLEEGHIEPGERLSRGLTHVLIN